MRKLYDCSVLHSEGNSTAYEMMPAVECDNLEEFISSVIALNVDCGYAEKEEVVRLMEGDYKVELDSDGEDNYVHVIVDIR